jgi:hypothetical protein
LIVQRSNTASADELIAPAPSNGLYAGFRNGTSDDTARDEAALRRG